MSSSNGRRNGAGMPALEQVLKGRRILLTGSTGFLGKVFLAVLLRWHPEIERVYLLIRGDRRSSVGRFRREILDSPVFAPLREHLGDKFDRYIEDKVVVVPGDITNDGLLGEEARPFKPGSLDAVVHSAGLVNFEASLEKAIEVNTTGVANVIEFCRKLGAAMMHVSTCYVAGSADGHRYEDDIPENWSPSGRKSFRLEREISDALAAIQRVQAESRDQLRHAEFHDHDGDADAPRESAIEHRRKQWVEERLKDVGCKRAQTWGWPNTYSYTKSLGEQLVLAHRDKLDVAVVRPAIIESALRDPFPGWNQGVNTSAPLTYLAGRGYRFYPAKADLVLDVIPVDLAAHAMIPILGALLSRKHKPIYQLCTSDRNPLPMRRLVELTALSNRREHRKDGGTMRWLGPHLEAVVVSQNTYDLASETLPQILKQAAAFARSVVGEENQRAKKIEAEIDKFKENTDLARELVEVYRPYIQELVYTFHASNIRALYASLKPADAERHPFRPDLIDWHDYWINIHLPGLRRHIFPQLDLHTRGRAKSLPRHRSLVDMLDRAADRYGSRVAMIARRPSGEQTQTTYRELRDRAHRAALLLATRGIKPGDRVLLIGENSPDWVLGYFAILCAGAIAVPLDQLISAEELAPIWKIAEPAAVLRSNAVHKRLGSTLGDAHPKLIELDLAELARPFILRGDAKTPPAPPERKALASILFTSGSTGAPKGVMLSHANFAAEIAMLSRVFVLGADDVVLSLLPLHHAFEFTCGMLLPLASGATIVYPLEVDAKTLSRTLADVRPTALIGVPAVWEAVHRRIVDEVEARGPFFHAAFDNLRDLNRRLDTNSGLNFGSIVFRQVHSALGGRLRLAVSGGSALPHRVAEFFNDIGIPLLEGYGLTEGAPVLSTARPDEPLQVGSVGRPLNGVEIKLAPATGSIGEIVAHGPNVMAGYYRNEAATAEVLRDGWLHTGDLGRFDDEGRLYIVGRAKEVIVDSGGNNIYIEELEEVYGRSEFVKEMAVVGLKVGQGEQVAALVVPAYARGESRRAVEDRLRSDFDKVARELSAHKRIRILRFTDAELPRTRTRKIKRTDVSAILRRMLDVRASDVNKETDNASSEVETWLAEALTSIATEPINITPATRLIEDLGLDSLALAEIGELIGQRASREIAPEEFADLRTVADLQLLASQPGGNGRPRMPSYAKFAEPYTVRLPAPLKWLGRFAVRGAERAIFDGWLKPKILGRGNIPANRNFIVVANHSSHLDFSLVGYALGAIGDDIRVLAAKDYFFNTPARRFLATNFTSMMPFDRERAQLESLEDALAELAQGRSVLMFPEGTRSADGEIHEFKSGAGFLALRSRCDVLPVLIRGTHDVMGKGSLVPRRHPVEVRIGRVIAASKLREIAQSSEGAGAYRNIADLMRSAVIALSGRRKSFPLTSDTDAAVSSDIQPATQSRAKIDHSPGLPRGRAKA
ncbi:AMP-binding protein [Candidatus Binatus sp.]|uniref:AMP-binding protein n=2 Tax=Candidatus Binatus sp. TaxID=2811406 RepID=UPI003C75D9F5